MTRHTITITEAFQVVVDGELIASLTRFEARYCQAIFSNPGVSTRDYLKRAVYGRVHVESKVFDVFVCHIRSKLGSHRNAIQTVSGAGYMANPDYVLDAQALRPIAVTVDPEAIMTIASLTGESADDLVSRLLAAEQERVTGVAA